MASSDYLPIGADPDLQAARTRAINQATAPDTEPPPPEHPTITYAKTLLSPMGPYGQPEQPTDLGSRLGAAQGLPTGNPLDLSGIGNLLGGVGQNLSNQWNQAFAPQNLLPRGTGTPFGPPAPISSDSITGKINAKLAAADAARTSAYNQGDPFGVLKGILGTVGAVTPQPPPAPFVGDPNEPGISDKERRDRITAQNAWMMVAGTFGPGGEGPKGPLGQRIASRAAEVNPGAATNEALAAAKGAEFAPGTGGALKPGSSAAEVAATRGAEFRSGLGGDEKIGTAQSVGALGQRYAVEVGKTRSVIRDTQTGETLPQMFTGKDLGESAAQAKADVLNAPTPTNPFAVPLEASLKAAVGYVTKAKTATAGETVGDVVRRAARSDPATVTPEFLATEPSVRPQLDAALAMVKVAATDETRTALAQQLLAQERARPTVGNRNAAAVREALGAPKEELPPIDFGPEPPPRAGLGGSGEPPPNPPGYIPLRGGGGGGMPPDVPLPAMPQRFNAGKFAVDATDEINAFIRAGTAGADVSTVGLQGAPLLLTDIVRTAIDPAGFAQWVRTGSYGTRPKPYFASALGKFAQALVAGEGAEGAAAGVYGKKLPFQPPTRIRQITAGFEDALAKKGIRAEDIGITHPEGGLTAREELAAGKIITNIPGLGLVYRQTSYATSTLLNALRTGEALRLQAAYEGVGLPFNSAKVGNFVKVATGRADLPFGIEGSAAARRAFQWLLFGPRLMTSAIKTVPDTIQAALGLGKSVVTRTPLDPVDIARVQTTATFVATGWGLMKIAEASGFAVGTDPEKTDFGRITLPGGIRIDFWGPFNEEARLIAREIAIAGRGLTGGKKPYGEADPLYSYLRSKLGPVASALESVRVGANQAGQTPQQVVQSTLANPNPLSNPESMVPAPFTAQTAALAFDPSRGGPSGLAGAGLTAAGALGISVLPPRQNVPKDGLGRPETDASFGKDAIFDEWTAATGETLGPPDGTIGSGDNKLKLPASEAEKYIAAVGNKRRIDIGNLIYSTAYQEGTKTDKEFQLRQTRTEADRLATRDYLAHGVIDSTDPTVIRDEAVAGFHAQGQSRKDQAYWVALLDRAGKLTPAVRAAIDESNTSRTGERAPITVAEYLHDAPLIHEYLSHVPFGTDKSPIGTPVDWTAVQAAKDQKSVLRDQYIRSGMNPSVADLRAQQDVLKGMTSMVQRNLFLNGTQLENPLRKTLALKYPTLAAYFKSHTTDMPESASEYQNFPFGR